MDIEKETTYIKRPYEHLPKEYKFFKEKEQDSLLNSIRNYITINKNMNVHIEKILKLFLLYEEKLNLPDMNLEELRLIFPYFFEQILYKGYFSTPTYGRVTNSFTPDKLKKIMELSKTKRIPILLGQEYELYEFKRYDKKKDTLGNHFNQILSQVDQEVIDSYMPLILQAGVFPGAESKISHIHSLSQLFQLFCYYDKIRRNIHHRLYWYTVDEQSRKSWDKTIYPGDIVEVEWDVFEFLQTRFTDWERKECLSEDAQNAVKALSSVIKKHIITEDHVQHIAYLFDGDLNRSRKFLTDHITGHGSVILDKQTLSKLITLSLKIVLDREENGKKLIRFMEAEKNGLHQLEANEPYWYTRFYEETETYILNESGITVKITLKHLDEERTRLVYLDLEGMNAGLKITFESGTEEYHPKLLYQNIWKKNKFQDCMKMIIEGEKKIEIPIPQIISIEKQALNHVNIEELIIKDTIEQLSENAFFHCTSLKKIEILGKVHSIEKKAFKDCVNLEEIILKDSLRFIGHNAFSGCTSLEEIIIPASVEGIGDKAFSECHYLRKVTIYNTQILNRIHRIFMNCEKLDSIMDTEGIDYMNLDPGFPVEDESVFQKNRIFWDKILREKPKKLIYLKEEDGEEDYECWYDDIYDEIPDRSQWCETIEELQILEGTKTIGDQFLRCPNLRSVFLPESLESLSWNAFSDQKELKNILLPKNAQVCIYNWEWFHYDGKLDLFKKLIIPDDHLCYKKVDSIVYEKDCLLWASDEMKGTVIIPEGIKRIKENAFYNCCNITEIILPKSLQVIEHGAFYGCTSLKKIVVQSEEVLIDSCDPDSEAYCYNWCSGTIITAKRDILDSSCRDHVIIECKQKPKNKPKSGRKTGKKNDGRLTYRPFADIYKLINNDK